MMINERRRRLVNISRSICQIVLLAYRMFICPPPLPMLNTLKFRSLYHLKIFQWYCNFNNNNNTNNNNNATKWRITFRSTTNTMERLSDIPSRKWNSKFHLNVIWRSECKCVSYAISKRGTHELRDIPVEQTQEQRDLPIELTQE